MCKLFGIVKYKENPNQEEFYNFVESMYLASIISGQDIDATGIVSWLDGEICVDKPGVNASEFVVNSPIWKYIKSSHPKICMCHARGAMLGSAKNPVNNHPFIGDNFAVMHVGWLPNHIELAKKHDLTLESECDSEFFLRFLEKQIINQNTGLKGLVVLYKDIVKWIQKALSLSTAYSMIAVLYHNTHTPSVFISHKRYGRPAVSPENFIAVRRSEHFGAYFYGGSSLNRLIKDATKIMYGEQYANGTSKVPNIFDGELMELERNIAPVIRIGSNGVVDLYRHLKKDGQTTLVPSCFPSKDHTFKNPNI